MILKYGQQAGWSTETWRRVEMLSAQQWADTLALPYGGRLGGEGRLETLPHIGCLLHKSSVPHKGSVNSGGERNSSEADHRHKAAGVARKTACCTRIAGMGSLAACSTGSGTLSGAWKSAEIGGEGADTLVRPYRARHWVERRAVGEGGQSRLESRPQARKPAPHRTRHGGHRKNKPQRTRRTRRWGERGRVEVERGGVRATSAVLAAVGDWNSCTARDCVALPA